MNRTEFIQIWHKWRAWIPGRPGSGWLAAGLVGVIVLAAKAWLVAGYGSIVPQMDQWDMESGLLYIAWREGAFTWSSLLMPINEHRIVFTQLTNLGLFLANGYWDPKVQMLAGAIVHAGVLSMIAAWGVARVRYERRAGVIILVMAGGGVPLAWENSLWGFQSQFYWLLLLGWGALWGWAAEGTPRRRLIGTLCLLAGPFAMSSGVLAAPAVVAARMCGALGRKRWSSADWLALMVASTAMCISALLWRHVDDHDALRSEGWGGFSWVMLRLLAWPWSSAVWLGAAVWLPWLTLVFLVATGRRAVTERSLIVVGLGGWVLAQIAAIAWARGVFMGQGVIPSKFLDLMWMGVVANGLVLLGSGIGRPLKIARIQSMVTAAWFTIIGAGGVLLAWNTVEQLLPQHRAAMIAQTMRMKAFLSTDDYGFLAGQRYPSIVYPEPERLALLARRARSAGILHPELRDAGPEWRDVAGLEPINYAAFNLGIEAFEWRSPLNRSGPWRWLSPSFGEEGGVWEFRTYADTGTQLVKFEVVELDGNPDGGRVVAVHRPPFFKWARWSVGLPPGRYGLRIIDERERGMVALIAPRKSGPLSAGAGWVCENAVALGVSAAVALAAVMTAQSPRYRMRPVKS